MSDGSNFLSVIWQEFQKADPESLNDGEWGLVEDGEIVVGKMDDPLKKLYAMLQNRKQELDEWAHAREQEFPVPDEVPEEKRRELSRYVRKAEGQINTIKELFWTSIRRQFDAYGGVDVGIRHGFQVVTFKSQSSPLDGLLDILIP